VNFTTLFVQLEVMSFRDIFGVWVTSSDTPWIYCSTSVSE